MRIIPNKECRHIVKPKKILDRYLYSDRMLSEEIIREYPDSSGNIAYAITRNSYGALVLNTSKVLFAGRSRSWYVSCCPGELDPCTDRYQPTHTLCGVSPEARSRAESLDPDSVSGLARLVRSFTILVSTIAPSTGVVKV